MSTFAHYRKTKPNGQEQVDPKPADEKSDEDDGCCGCLTSKSKPSGERQKPNVKSDAGKQTSEEQGKKGIQNGHSNGSNKKAWLDHHMEPSNSPGLYRDRQGIPEKVAYKELDHLKEAINGAKQLSALNQGNSDGSLGKAELSPLTEKGGRQEGIKYTGSSPAGMPKSSLGYYSSEDEKQKSDFRKEKVNNESRGGTWPDLTKGKGNNGSNGGTRSDPTEKAMSSSFGQAPPLKEKQKVTSTFEHAGPPPRKEKEKAIGSTAEQADSPPWKKKEKAIASTFEPTDPTPWKEKERNLPKHSQHKDVHKREYNQENHKNTWQDFTKKETSSPEQAVEPIRTGKQNKINRLEGINNNHDY